MGPSEPFYRELCLRNEAVWALRQVKNLDGTFLQAEIWIYDHPNAKQEWYPPDSDIGQALYLKWRINTSQRPQFCGYGPWKHMILWRMPSSGMRFCIDLVWTDISEERIASIFRVQKSASEESAWAGGCGLSHQSKTTSKKKKSDGERGGHMGDQYRGEG
jgi:hypothetical protein